MKIFYVLIRTAASIKLYILTYLLNSLCKHMKKVKSSQAAIIVLYWLKQFFPSEYRFIYLRIFIQDKKAPVIIK